MNAAMAEGDNPLQRKTMDLATVLGLAAGFGLLSTAIILGGTPESFGLSANQRNLVSLGAIWGFGFPVETCSAGIVIFVVGRRCGDFADSSLVRTHAQLRAERDCPISCVRECCGSNTLWRRTYDDDIET